MLFVGVISYFYFNKSIKRKNVSINIEFRSRTHANGMFQLKREIPAMHEVRKHFNFYTNGIS